MAPCHSGHCDAEAFRGESEKLSRSQKAISGGSCAVYRFVLPGMFHPPKTLLPPRHVTNTVSPSRCLVVPPNGIVLDVTAPTTHVRLQPDVGPKSPQAGCRSLLFPVPFRHWLDAAPVVFGASVLVCRRATLCPFVGAERGIMAVLEQLWSDVVWPSFVVALGG